MTALLQFEVDKKRLRCFGSFPDTQYNGQRTPLYAISIGFGLAIVIAAVAAAPLVATCFLIWGGG